MSHHETATAAKQAPNAAPPTGPDPALRQFDRFVGTWELKGRTIGSDSDNITARTTFEWLPGGHFLLQRFSADFVGMDIHSHEVIGFDPASGTFPSTVYSNMAPLPLPYRWAIDGDELTITAEALGATFRGRWNEDGTLLGRLATRSRPRERSRKRALRHLRQPRLLRPPRPRSRRFDGRPVDGGAASFRGQASARQSSDHSPHGSRR